jgi:hypothetical protein
MTSYVDGIAAPVPPVNHATYISSIVSRTDRWPPVGERLLPRSPTGFARSICSFQPCP